MSSEFETSEYRSTIQPRSAHTQSRQSSTGFPSGGGVGGGGSGAQKKNCLFVPPIVVPPFIYSFITQKQQQRRINLRSQKAVVVGPTRPFITAVFVAGGHTPQMRVIHPRDWGKE
uniref:Uncharacterized protein n=1 Tax=Globodera rostochiensis TaxID=31243 RepID=A0A914HFN1_GLORO